MFKKLFHRWFDQRSYGSMMERYIISGYPKSIYDVERLTREFDLKLSRGEHNVR
jgi:hypothetical protein